MKTIILFLFFFLGLNNYAQNSRNLTVEYKLYIAENNNSKSNDLLKSVASENGKITFNLFINDSVSYFIENNGISSSELSVILAMAKAKYYVPLYYCNKIFLQNNDPSFVFFYNNEFLIERKSNLNWNITSETKMIDGNLCYKAVSSDYYYHTKNDRRNFEVTAWFCPKLPFKFGPMYYNDLPGLILETSYLDVRLIATKIEYKLDPKSISKPFGDKSISFDDYSSELTNKMKEMFGELEKIKK